VTSSSRSDDWFTPRFPLLIAGAVFLVAALALFYPMLSGQFLGGQDQIVAGYAFRALAEQGMHQSGHIPQWNPYIFGGMPLWAVPGHFDVFYPTAWLRWIVRADTALTLAFFIHFIVAGIAMYALLRALRVSWTGSVVGGLAYELTGAVASQMNPGHDGKLFAAALAPFALLALLRAIRGGRRGYFGWFALVIGLVMLTPHYLAAYYILVACGLFTLWLVFLDPERPATMNPIVTLACAAAAVVVGLGVAGVELIPVQHMVAYTARGAGGESLGYAYASSWGMAPVELMSIILPQFNGLDQFYWGPNFFKTDTPYMGAVIFALAILGFGAVKRRKLLLPLGVIGILFLLVSWGGYSPFYHLWILMPKMGQFRAPGLAFFIVALVGCVFAGFGVDRLFDGTSTTRSIYTIFGVLGSIALLGVVGALQGLAEGLAGPAKVPEVVANAPELTAGSARLLAVIIVGAVIVILVRRGILRGLAAALLLAAIVIGDNWSILQKFAPWFPPASTVYADDPFMMLMEKSPLPYRVYSPASPDNPDPQQHQQFASLTLYAGARLMVNGIPMLLGYHGMEDRFFDALLGGKNVWQYQLAPHMWDLFAVKYVALARNADSIPGYHRIAGPMQLSDMVEGPREGTLFERDSAIQWVRVVPAAAKLADDQIPQTVASTAFALNSYVVFSDTATVNAPPLASTAPLPAPSNVQAKLTAWAPGAMSVALTGSDPQTSYLVVAENWYPDWHATVDGKDVTPLRGDGSLLTVPLPAGAKSVTLTYDIAAYGTGKLVTLISLILVVVVLGIDRIGVRKTDG
jgi:hypothetical protein